MVEGRDKNSKFFHCVANGRRRSNHISEISFNGVKITDPPQVRNGVFLFFKDHFKNVRWSRPKIRSLGLKQIFEEEIKSLEVVFSKEEVSAVVYCCDGDKAIDPDGLNLRFIKANWENIQEDFLKFILEFHGNRDIVKDLNNTFITLIPKCFNPEIIKDFKPISLVGSMYKIFAEVLANRQIIDSFVIAEEIIHTWRKSKEMTPLVKLDFEKAYDSVDHSFLDSTLEDMRFSLKWRQWVKSCISSPSLSVLVNGCPTDQFLMERGLRQGDPVLPFLFNIVVECLSCLFKKAQELNLVRGVSFGNAEVHISHLQFADDTILLLKQKWST
ncbi:hypothetical protein Dsin_025633 [Dipteronia sinensis]|uniref:Reverse transcriptase domain-containing protein n=1 Tax=Dipteronia sinensis TaxID=43782 RepID=A0AAD9ZXQ9_9ROSI|nr:hypothetical protein Dsin_025633 [Dipteronia sinensis]